MVRDDTPISRRAAFVATHAPTQRTPRRPLLCNAWCVSAPPSSPPASSARSRPTPPPIEAYPPCPFPVAPAAAAVRRAPRLGARARPPGTRAARGRDEDTARGRHVARPSRRRVLRDRGRPPPARRFGALRASRARKFSGKRPPRGDRGSVRGFPLGFLPQMTVTRKETLALPFRRRARHPLTPIVLPGPSLR